MPIPSCHNKGYDVDIDSNHVASIVFVKFPYWSVTHLSSLHAVLFGRKSLYPAGSGVKYSLVL